MTSKTYDVVAIGNAIVDVLVHADDRFLGDHGLTKGTMALVDEAQAERLYASVGAGLETSGGSAANTVAGIAQLGGRAGFIGRVRNDQLGAIFAHDIRGPVRDSARLVRRLHSPLPDPGHPRCPAHHVHLSGGVGGTRPR
jgi:sugar/nucleoside kinase (ribokinase family)